MHLIKSLFFHVFLSLITFPRIIPSKHSSFQAIRGCSFGTPAFDRGICMNVIVNVFAKPDGAPAIVFTAKLSGADVTDSSAFRRTFYGHVLFRASAADFVVIGTVKGDNKFA